MKMSKVEEQAARENKTVCVKHYLLEECFAMIKHLSAIGHDIPASASEIISYSKEDCCKIEMDDNQVLKLHRDLSRKIAPAMPKTIWLLYKESQSKQLFSFLGPVSLIRRLMIVAFLSLGLFILISCSSTIRYENIDLGIFELYGLKLFVILIFYLAAASLGACFSSLFQANRYIVKNVYDPKYETSYWTRYVLGLIAGVMLATIIPISLGSDSVAQIGENGAPIPKNLKHLAVASRPILAMLGGFSSALVYRILFRLVYAVESLFIGKKDDKTDLVVAEMQAKMEAENENVNIQFIGTLLEIKNEISSGKSKEEIIEKLDNQIKSI